uniref:Dpy-19 like C-mannosyltransferase 3 n=1 Tax=Equus caballus TaxID=9796 RepID=A0A5F5PUA7_HORSE
MISIRQRKGIKTTEVSEDYAAQEENVKLENKLPSGCTSGRLWKILSFTIGGTVALCIGLLTSVYLATLHENDLWFSNIKGKNRKNHSTLTDGREFNQTVNHVCAINMLAEGMIPSTEL